MHCQDDSTAAILTSLIQQAIIDAACFVEEFGEPLDPAKTDWDSVAWGESKQWLGINDGLWPTYQAALVTGTKIACRLGLSRRDQNKITGSLKAHHAEIIQAALAATVEQLKMDGKI